MNDMTNAMDEINSQKGENSEFEDTAIEITQNKHNCDTILSNLICE